MFYKQYPRNCTTFNTSFERSLSVVIITTSPKIITGCGDWMDENNSGIFFIWKINSHNFSTYATIGFRDSIYVS
jgi:hypothetical protein